MCEKNSAVESMKKITLLLEGSAGKSGHFLVESFDFVYGIGPRGLSPLEAALAGKKEGEEIILHLGRDEMESFFQHVITPSLEVPEQEERITLKVRVAKVETPEQREVIKAMAEAAACSRGCCGH